MLFHESQFSLRPRTIDGITVFELRGKILDPRDAERLRVALDESMDRGSFRIILDFSLVPWVNSQGIGVLMSTVASARPRGVVVKLLGVNDRVRSVLDVTRLSPHFEFFAEMSDAIASFGSDPRSTSV